MKYEFHYNDNTQIIVELDEPFENWNQEYVFNFLYYIKEA